MKLKKKFELFNRFYKYADICEAYHKWIVLIDFLICRSILGFKVEEYFRNNLYSYKWNKKKEFLPIRTKIEALSICNDATKISEIDNKAKFNHNFEKYLKRDWVNMASCSFEELKQFTMNHSIGFLKASNGQQGIGAEKLNFTNLNLEEFYEKHSGLDLVIEELIEQCDEMASFNESTVNTIRVVTLRGADDNVSIIGVALRLGRKGQIADNFHSHGIAANANAEDGFVYTCGVDHYFKRYLKHPDSLKAIPGFQIPLWSEIRNTVIEAANVVPEVRYIGWDVAITNSRGVCLIEGNSTSCVDVIEMPSLCGVWKKIKPMIREIERKEKYNEHRKNET